MNNKLCKKRNIYIIVSIAIAITFIIALSFSINYSKNKPEDTLLKFYNSIYLTSDIDAMTECMVESYQYYFENAVTMAGMEPEYYKRYGEDAVGLFGDDFTIKIEILNSEKLTDKAYNKLRNNDAKISDALNINYSIIFSSSKLKKSFNNSMSIVKVDGKWYMTTHLSLPIGKNVYAY